MISETQIRVDLEWAISSPALLKTGENFELPRIDNGPLPIQPKTHRVGHYFESLIDYWLTEIRGVEIIAHNHQVQDGKRTVGEVDFVFRNENTGVITHWETAVKFYLAWSGRATIGSQFIGPNAGDTLEKKHARIVEHQIPMGKRAFPQIEMEAAFVKGMIFYHPKESEDVKSDLLADDHQRGLWLRESELDHLDQFGPEARFQILQKPLWLAPPQQLTPLTVSEMRDQLDEHFKNYQHPNLISALDSNGKEIERIFIVSDAWPNEIS